MYQAGVEPALNSLARELREVGLMSSQRTVMGTTERISGMRALGGGEMLSKLAVAVPLGLRLALYEHLSSVEMKVAEDTYSALEMAAGFIPVSVG